MSGGRPRLVIFSDDWGRHPSSAQHLARHLLDTYDIDWVNTFGTRRPSLSLVDMKRGFEKLGDWLRTKRAAKEHGESAPLPPGLRVHAPLHWPGFGRGWERALNRSLLLRALSPLFAEPRPRAVITTVPITADLAAATPHVKWVYYCVDDLAAWPGLDAGTLRTMERDLLDHVACIVAVSDHLAAAHRGRAPLYLLTHGVALEHWAAVRRRRPRAGGERATALFWGLADARLDTPVVLALAEACELVMAGPQAADLDPRLKNHPGIRWRGTVPFAQLPREAEQADVLVMPYADLPVTRAMQPLKLKEYLATGLPTIVTPLPANRLWEDALDIVESPIDFAARADARARGALPEAQRIARARLAEESWAAKARQLQAWIETDDAARAA
jgi:glycosyltransferase involved in cell wall biosynthesis